VSLGAVRVHLGVLAPILLLLAACAGAPPQITSLSPVNGSRGVAADEPVVVTFDHPVDRASVPPRFHVEPALLACDVTAAFSAATTAPCHVEWRPDGSGFRLLHPHAPFAPDTTYRFSLDPGISDDHGVANGLDHHWQIQSGSAPVVRSTSPGDGGAAVAVDAPLAVTFSVPMSVATTTAAIHLAPAVPGTRVAPNANDHSRFVVIPGRLLAPGGSYTLSIDTTATDEHGQRLANTAAAHFITGGLAAVGHAVVLARHGGELPSVLQLTRRSPDQTGDPLAAATLLTAPRCPLAGCAIGGTLESSYLAAAISPSGTQLAVAEHPSDGTPDRLVLFDLMAGRQTVIATPGDLPAWSADGRFLAFAAGGEVDLYDPATGATSHLPSGDPLVAPPVWSADASVLALPVQHAGAGPHVELADPALLIRYPVPGVTGSAVDPALSPDGSVLAVHLQQPGPGTYLERLRGAGAPQLLGPTLTPLAWADAGTLIAVDRPVDAPASIARVSVASGDVAHLAAGPRASDLSTAVADVSGRSVGYLLPDAAGVLQAWAMNQDGSNPTMLTSFGPADGLEAIGLSLGS
jgi:hypothetical protein